jgi:hypothetical protein
MAMTLVETVTVGSGGAASITFSSIPQTGKDLVLLISPRSSNASLTVSTTIKFNASSTGYSGRYLYGSGSSAASSSYSTTQGYLGDTNAASSTASTFSNVLAYIPNYTGSTAKSFSSDSVMENNATEAYQFIYASSWSGTDAITSIELSNFGNFAQHSTASLYIVS